VTKRHNYKLGYTVTRLGLQAAGLVRPAPKRSAHRHKRPRRELPGMMLHQDASRFAWLPAEVGQYDLVVTLDDATSAIYSAFLVEEEGTLLSFRGIAEVIGKHGLFCELYTNRGSNYFHTPKDTARFREGDRVADVGEADDVGEGALETEAEAGMRHSAVAAQIAVPGVVLPVDAALGHVAVQDREPLLAGCRR
jgi:hypothetical protein